MWLTLVLVIGRNLLAHWFRTPVADITRPFLYGFHRALVFRPFLMVLIFRKVLLVLHAEPLYHVDQVAILGVQLPYTLLVLLVAFDTYLVAARYLMLVVFEVLSYFLGRVLVEEADGTFAGAMCWRRV
jgi:hypothetical protein